jgi:hypothetical protein
MSEIVEPDAREASDLEPALECPNDLTAVKRTAMWGREHQALPRRPWLDLCLLLPSSVIEERRHSD